MASRLFQSVHLQNRLDSAQNRLDCDSVQVRVRVRARDGKWVLFLLFFFSALKSDEHLCDDATCGNVVCDVLRLSP